jgi:hypothetical protein
MPSLKTVILDNDQCTGCYTELGVLFNYCMTRLDTSQCHQAAMLVARYLFHNGMLRPGTGRLLQYLARWKASGAIDRVVMFTAATNGSTRFCGGYVHFLKQCLETYAGTPGLFDHVFARDSKELKPVHWDPTGYMWKELNRVAAAIGSDSVRYFSIVDDRANYAVVTYDDGPVFVTRYGESFKALGVSPYFASVPTEHVRAFLTQVQALSGRQLTVDYEKWVALVADEVASFDNHVHNGVGHEDRQFANMVIPQLREFYGAQEVRKSPMPARSMRRSFPSHSASRTLHRNRNVTARRNHSSLLGSKSNRTRRSVKSRGHSTGTR